MAEVARSPIAQHPLGRTVYTLAQKKFSGRLVVTGGGGHSRLDWLHGQVVGAHSPNSADSIARIALKAGLASTTQIQAVLRAQAAHPDRDLGDILGEVAKLSTEQLTQLRRHALATAAGRSFAQEDGELVIDDEVTASTSDVPPVAVHWLIYFGVRSHYSLDRLKRELSVLANASFELAPSADPYLGQFGFGPAEQRCLDMLRAGAMTSRELGTKMNGQDPQLILAVLYALWATDCLAIDGQAPVRARGASTPPPAQETAPAPAQQTAQPPAQQTAPAPDTAPPPAADTGNKKIKIRRARKRTSAPELEKIIRQRLAVIDSDGSHYELLGVENGCSAADLRKAYFALAKQIHPDRLQAMQVDVSAKDGQRLFAKVNIAFSVLSNPKKRSHYQDVLAAGGEAAYAKKLADEEKKALALIEAEEHFRVGEMALRRNQYAEALSQFTQAVTLNPKEGEHHAMLAWATWLDSSDKDAVASECTRTLERALELSPKCAPALFYLGQIAKHRKRIDTAIDYFQQVLRLQPHNNDAQLEIRLLRGRQA